MKKRKAYSVIYHWNESDWDENGGDGYCEWDVITFFSHYEAEKYIKNLSKEDVYNESSDLGNNDNEWVEITDKDEIGDATRKFKRPSSWTAYEVCWYTIQCIEIAREVMEVYSIVIHNKWGEHKEFIGVYSEEDKNKLVDSLNKMNYAEAKYGKDYYIDTIEMFIEPLDDNYVEQFKNKVIENFNQRKRKEIDEISYLEESLGILEKTREIFAPFDLVNNLTKDNFGKCIKDLHKAIMDNMMNIILFDDMYEYRADGTIKRRNDYEEREYEPIIIPRRNYDQFGYLYGKYNIDDDISRVYERIRRHTNELTKIQNEMDEWIQTYKMLDV